MSETSRKINCIIVDDEPLAQDVLERYISQHEALQLISKKDSAIQAFESLHQNDIDLMFLDINMPIISGMDFLKSLSHPPLVVFTTAYPDYALDGFELDAVDYLLKPISKERFDKAIEKIFQRLQRNIDLSTNFNPLSSTAKKDYIFVKADGKLIKVMFEDLVYCEGMKDYIKLYLKSKKYLVIHQTMKAMEELLPDNIFMRIHKSYIASIPAIKTIQNNMISFIDTDVSIPVSISYKDELLKRLNP